MCSWWAQSHRNRSRGNQSTLPVDAPEIWTLPTAMAQCAVRVHLRRYCATVRGSSLPSMARAGNAGQILRVARVPRVSRRVR
jgi:hypothetical protein